MLLLAHKVAVTLADGSWIAVIDIGIEIPDARTIDAHVVGKAEIDVVGHTHAETCRWHKVVEVLAEVFATA